MPRQKYQLEARRKDDNTKHTVVHVTADSTGQAIKKARPVIAKRLGTDEYVILSADAHGSRGYGNNWGGSRE